MKTIESNPFIPYYSATYTRQYLTTLYEQRQLPQPQANGYRLCYPFIYYLQHGQAYFEQAARSPTILKPVLLFYGLIQFIKGCILTKDPHYPESSQVLAHGVTTRKRKKTAYRFLQDEVKIQRHGLFSHFLKHLFHMEHMVGQKYNMLTLLQQIADIHPLFTTMFGEEISFKGEFNNHSFIFSSDVLDAYHMTPNRFEQYLQSYQHSAYNRSERIYEKDGHVHIPLITTPKHLYSSPWLFNVAGFPYLLKCKADSRQSLLPELAVHYLLLYNLSMIARYEIEWWGELVSTFDGTDYPFIIRYLSIAEEKLPPLISFILQEQKS